ncbi:MAG TPA: HutD family protein [Rhizomicrobium sp.]|nr:HutD family protein [Rhizomicrobium sp.]
MKILRVRDRIVTPWKNGGGTTAEIAAYPPGAGLDDFHWRVSVADVRTGGPFSHFAGVDRKLALLKGALSLTIEEQGTIALTPHSRPLAFPGDVRTDAVLTSDVVQDLNVMTRRGVAISTVTRQRSIQIAPTDASVCIAYFLSDAASFDGETILAAGDAVMLASGETLNLRAEAEFYRIEVGSSAPHLSKP